MTAKMNDKLLEIIEWKKFEVEKLKPKADELRRLALQRNDFRGFRSALFQPGYPTLIAEVKKASPSAGIIDPNFNPINQARVYERAGAQCLSVLTDEKFFQGSLEYLRDIRDQVDLPLLRKDFTISPLQVYESVVAGADAILLIVAALEDDQMAELFELAKTLQLDVLVEVHDLREMDRALDLGADIIGINNRNLKTFKVDLQTTADLAGEIPGDCLAISESGIKTRDDVLFLQNEGVYCYLIGETLMRSGNVKETVVELLGEREGS